MYNIYIIIFYSHYEKFKLNFMYKENISFRIKINLFKETIIIKIITTNYYSSVNRLFLHILLYNYIIILLYSSYYS
jgi:hypothetical protein